MTYATLCNGASKASHDCILANEHGCSRGWLTPMVLPFLNLTVLSRFRFPYASACPRRGVAVEASGISL